MSESANDQTEQIDIVIPRQGLLYHQESPDYIFCKPKLIPLKSVTLEKLEKMQKDAERKMKAQEIENVNDTDK